MKIKIDGWFIIWLLKKLKKRCKCHHGFYLSEEKDGACPKCSGLTKSKEGYLGIRKTGSHYYAAQIKLGNHVIYCKTYSSRIKAAVARDLCVVNAENGHTLNFWIDYESYYKEYKEWKSQKLKKRQQRSYRLSPS